MIEREFGDGAVDGEVVRCLCVGDRGERGCGCVCAHGGVGGEQEW